jgi:hypothetical protein
MREGAEDKMKTDRRGGGHGSRGRQAREAVACTPARAVPLERRFNFKFK